MGVSLSALTVGASVAGLLRPLESWLYHWRSRQFQFFTPAPTNRLLHLDIDDTTLEMMGEWPWPRRDLARILDTLDRLGARVVGLDVILTGPSPYAAHARAFPEDDETFARSMARFERVALPLSLSISPRDPPDARTRAARAFLGDHLQASREDLRRALRDRGLIEGVTADELQTLYFQARRGALYERSRAFLAAHPDASRAEARRRLLPHQPAGESNALIEQFRQQFRTASAMHEMRRFTRPADRAPYRPLPGHDQMPPLPAFARTAGACGYVDYLPYEDGVVRAVPLWVAHEGRLFAHFSLAIVCQTLGVKLEDIRIERGRTVIPREAGSSIVVPTQRHYVDEAGETYGGFAPIPWIGETNDWATMYDHPEHEATDQHMPVSAVWKIIRQRERIEQNNRIADRALKFFYATFYPDRLDRYESDPPPAHAVAPRAERIRTLREDPFIARTVDQLKRLRSEGESLKERERLILENWQRLEQVLEINVTGDPDRDLEPLTKRLERQKAQIQQRVAGRTVLIGWTATGAIADFVTTSLHARCPGVVVHGALVNGMISGHLWAPAPVWASPLLTLVIGILVTALTAVASPLRSGLAALLIAAGWVWVNGLLVFDYGDHLLAMGAPLVSVGLVWSGCTVYRFVSERAERARITRRFQSYVDPALVEHVLEHPEQSHFAGDTRELSVVFIDLAGFTTLTERLGPEAVKVLNDFMGRMVPVIRRHDGFVNKFLGDGLMFFYGAPRPNPRHAEAAIASVVEMQQTMEQFARDLRERGLPEVRMRAGLVSGPMLVGDAGPPQASDYTVLGDAVNLAARLESANKAAGTRTLVNERALELSGDRFLVRPIGKLRVVGKEEGVMVYEPLCERSEATEREEALVRGTTAIVDAYRAGRFADCLEAATAFESAWGEAKLAALYRERARALLAEAPESFDGQIVLEQK